MNPRLQWPAKESLTYQSFVTGTRSAYWRLLRKGTADAFSPQSCQVCQETACQSQPNLIWPLLIAMACRSYV